MNSSDYICTVVDCGVTTLPLGQVSVTSTTFGSVATYSCATGYDLSGPDTRVCQDDGTWSGIELTCESECNLNSVKCTDSVYMWEICRISSSYM